MQPIADYLLYLKSTIKSKIIGAEIKKVVTVLRVLYEKIAIKQLFLAQVLYYKCLI